MKILIQRHEAFRWFLVVVLAGYAIWACNAQAGDVTAQQPGMTSDFESLRSLLKTRGWRVEQSPDGSTLLFPLRDTPQIAAAGDKTTQQPAMTGDFESLRSLLETRGWRAERTPDGSTLLFPLRKAPPAQGGTPQAQEPAPALITLTVSPEHMQRLRELLDGYKWDLVQEGSKDLHLLAPAHPHALAPARKVDCVEEQQEMLFTAGVKLPVNTEEEAWLVSSNWLWAYGHTELEVGEIRNINWIYLANIVDKRPPYRSRNQLIINKRSGQLLPLY